jgi:hypothetical protein
MQGAPIQLFNTPDAILTEPCSCATTPFFKDAPFDNVHCVYTLQDLFPEVVCHIMKYDIFRYVNTSALKVRRGPLRH